MRIGTGILETAYIRNGITLDVSHDTRKGRRGSAREIRAERGDRGAVSALSRKIADLQFSGERAWKRTKGYVIPRRIACCTSDSVCERRHMRRN